jgi:CheY-like chemotaxis protein
MSPQSVQENVGAVSALLQVIANPQRAMELLEALDKSSRDAMDRVGAAHEALAAAQQAASELVDHQKELGEREKVVAVLEIRANEALVIAEKVKTQANSDAQGVLRQARADAQQIVIIAASEAAEIDKKAEAAELRMANAVREAKEAEDRLAKAIEAMESLRAKVA